MHHVPSAVMSIDVEAAEAGLYEMPKGLDNSDTIYEPIDTYTVPTKSQLLLLAVAVAAVAVVAVLALALQVSLAGPCIAWRPPTHVP